MIQNIFFDGISSQELGFYVAGVTVNPPKPKTTYVDIPYANGKLDLSDYYGEVFYQNRQITIDGLIKDNIPQTFLHIVQALNGKHFQEIQIEGLTYTGRVTIGQKRISTAGTFSMTVEATPGVDTYDPDLGDAKTHIVVDLPAGYLTPTLCLDFQEPSEVLIAWGDGSNSTLTGNAGLQSVSHEYETQGTYTIRIGTVSGSYLLPSNTTVGGYFLTATTTPTAAADVIYKTFIKELDIIDIGLRAISPGLCFGMTSLQTLNVDIPIDWNGGSICRGCTILTAVKLPAGMTSIGASDFYACSALAAFNVPIGITTIGNHAFQRSGLTSITLPETLTTIETGAFQACSLLAEITLPDAVTTIPEACFQGCSNLRTVAFPEAITAIDFNAFGSTRNITLLDFSKAQQVPTLSNTTFTLSAGARILVPAALYSEWTTATNWSTYAQYIEAV